MKNKNCSKSSNDANDKVIKKIRKNNSVVLKLFFAEVVSKFAVKIAETVEIKGKEIKREY